MRRLRGLLVLGGVLGVLLAAPAYGQEAEPSPFFGIFEPPAASATPTPEPAATPPPNQVPARLHLGQVRASKGKLRMALSARGGSLDDVRIAIRRVERTVRAVKLGTLSGTRRLALAPRGGLAAGLYVIRVTVAGFIAADREITVR